MARKADPNKRNNIIEAATLVFARKGYSATRIIEVAEAACVGKGTIYEYFRSKEALFFAVFEAIMHQAGESIAQTASDLHGSFAQRMTKLSDSIIQSWLGQIDMYGLVMEFWSATASFPDRDRFRKAFRDGYRDLRTVVAGLIQSAMQKGEIASATKPWELASSLIGTWDALLLQTWLDPGFDPLATSRAFMEVVLRGLELDVVFGNNVKKES